LRDELLLGIRQNLAGRGIELADPVQTADALRRSRLRNTTELGVEELQSLSSELSAAYVLTGSIHRFESAPEAAEMSLAARLIYIPDLTVVWARTAALYTGGPVSLFTSSAGSDTARLIGAGVRRLLGDFAFKPLHPLRAVSDLRSARGDSRTTYPCRRIALIPLANETTTEFGGEMISDQLFAALYHRGFQIVDAGRVREVMLNDNDLSRGELTLETLRHLHDDLAVDLVLTGSVSTLTSADATRFGDMPEIAVELRIVDAASGLVIWSRNFSRRGSDSEGLFGTRKSESAALMARDLARDAVGGLRTVRAKSDMAQ
jgi:TolB-like protein